MIPNPTELHYSYVMTHLKTYFDWFWNKYPDSIKDYEKYYGHSDSKDSIYRCNVNKFSEILYAFEYCVGAYVNRSRNSVDYKNNPDKEIYNFKPILKGSTRTEQLYHGCLLILKYINEIIEEPTITGDETGVPISEWNAKIDKLNEFISRYGFEAIKKVKYK
jgi:hypothetical protein